MAFTLNFQKELGELQRKSGSILSQGLYSCNVAL